MKGFSLSERWRGREIMDDPACDDELLLNTVRQFASINFWVSRSRGILKRWLLSDVLQTPDRSAHVVDLGAGGCDLAVWLLREAKRLNLALTVTAVDADERIAAYAHKRHGHVEGLNILCGTHDALKYLPPVDYVFSNHVLHHMHEEELTAFLQVVQASARRRWIMNDLERSVGAYAGFQVFGRFYRNSFAFEDGKKSIRRAYRKEELEQLLDTAGMKASTHVQRLLPGRLLVVGKV